MTIMSEWSYSRTLNTDNEFYAFVWTEAYNPFIDIFIFRYMQIFPGSFFKRKR